MALAVGSVSSVSLNSVSSNESGGALSPEDVAWADSCLIKDLAISDNGLDSRKYSLPETFPSRTIFSAVSKDEFPEESLRTIFSAVSKDDSPEESRNYPSIKETGVAEMLDDMIDHVSPTDEQEGNTIFHQINNNDCDSFSSRINTENVFLPTYKEGLRLVEASDSESDSEFPTIVEENLVEDIFKVWELDIPDEEDELVQQLKKALAGSSLESSPSASGNVGVVDSKLLDDLISGLGSLSLSPPTD